MPTCVVNILGVLTVTSDPIETCPGWVLLDAATYTAQPTLTDIFAMPVSTDLAEMWAVGFSLPLTMYLVAWALGVVVNFIND